MTTGASTGRRAATTYRLFRGASHILGVLRFVDMGGHIKHGDLRMIRRVLLALALAPLFSCSQTPQPVSSNLPVTRHVKPNVLWIVLDACRAENLSCYGYDRVTSPAIDALAACGAVFEQHFTQGLWTKLSVPSYMTGRYFPVSCLDFGRNINFPRDTAKGELLAPTVFHANGYRTLMVAAHPYFSPASRLYQAFDDAVLVPPEGDPPYPPFDRLMNDISRRLEQNAGKPFFMYVHAMDTHFPHRTHVPPDGWARLDYESPAIKNGEPVRPTGCTFSEEDRHQLRGLHDASILGADRSIARIVETLERLGVLGKTILLISSDHGDALGEDGASWGHAVTFDEVMRVPLVMAGPGVPEGARIRNLTEHVDLLPTLIDLCGLTTDAVVDGKSLAPILRGEPSEPLHAYAVTRYTHRTYDGEPEFLMRDAAFKLDCDRVTGKSLLYSVPDTVAGRTPCASGCAEAAARLRQRIEEDLMPKWREFDRLPKHYFLFDFTEDFLRSSMQPLESIQFETEGGVSEERCGGGRWIWAGGVLGAAPWAKEVPALTFHANMPPGRYSVSLIALAGDAVSGHNRSQAEIQINGEPAFRRVILSTSASDADEVQFREVGVYDLRNAGVTVTVRTGDREWWSLLKGIRFTPIEDGKPDPKAEADARQRDEQLRALGYLK